MEPEQRNKKKILDGVRAIALPRPGDILEPAATAWSRGPLQRALCRYFFPPARDEKRLPPWKGLWHKVSGGYRIRPTAVNATRSVGATNGRLRAVQQRKPTGEHCSPARLYNNSPCAAISAGTCYCKNKRNYRLTNRG